MRRKIVPYNPHLKLIARKLRNDSTLGEILLWQELKSKKLKYDFHRQKPLLNYIVDFYCYELNLVIEVDGRYHHHEETYEQDLKRDQDLRNYQLTVLRFTEQELKTDINNVLRCIEAYISEYEGNDTPL